MTDSIDLVRTLLSAASVLDVSTGELSEADVVLRWRTPNNHGSDSSKTSTGE